MHVIHWKWLHPNYWVKLNLPPLPRQAPADLTHLRAAMDAALRASTK